MRLRSLTMKGFKSFPQRTRLEFAPGVSVVVGPNGSGKSNITEAVLWALGEQSPLAVRGQTMKDVIFAGGHGLSSSGSAEVEVVLDNADRELPSDFSEISITRRLDRSGDGEYRLNGARCRLVDVLEVLSDSGLGKEMHSVVSQGKVETIVHSRPRERRLLIEEAAGLGKHRKRRRRSQLKLERTEENLSRALDVEREARSRLRPLKRQAEAAELHERLERQSLEARLEVSRDVVRAARAELAAAEARAAAATGERDEAERLLADVAARREAAEQAFATQAREREALQGRLFAARSAAEGIALRLERARDQARAAAEGAERRRHALAAVEQQLEEGSGGDSAAGRIEQLETELAGLTRDRDECVHEQLARLEADLDGARGERERLQAQAAERASELEAADAASEAARARRRQAERELEAVREQAARARADLAAVDGFLGAAGGEGRVLSDGLRVEPGYELALAAALGPRLGAAVAEDVSEAQRLLESSGERGGLALVADRGEPAAAGAPPLPGAERLLDRVEPEAGLLGVAQRLLEGVWIVRSLAALPRDFAGVAVTRAGRLLDGRTGELLQVPLGGGARVLEERNRRDEHAAVAERAAAEEGQRRVAAEQAGRDVAQADAARDEAEVALRRAGREAERAAEAESRCEWVIARRREAPDDGPEAVRRAELAADLRAEKRIAERAGRERRDRLAGAERLRAAIARLGELEAAAERGCAALEAAHAAISGRGEALAAELQAGAASGAETSELLRACAHQEAELQGRLKGAAESVTTAEVAAQQVRDSAREAEAELAGIAGRLELPAEPAVDALEPERRAELRARVERLARRREQLGPVNPLAKQEYEEAVTHVEELEGQRGDLESALSELQGLIRETDRRIRQSFDETFQAAAANFEEVVGHLFPGGRGRLRLVQPDGPRAVIGGEEPEQPEPENEDEDAPPVSEPGVEVEVTPAGKATRRLSLLSGGEKSLVALAFMFAVFLARPCPFYVLDEVEAALDDVNIDRFLELVRRYSDRAQFIVVTHQRRTMGAADRLYGVSMAGDGVSRVVSRRMDAAAGAAPAENAALSA